MNLELKIPYEDREKFEHNFLEIVKKHSLKYKMTKKMDNNDNKILISIEITDYNGNVIGGNEDLKKSIFLY